MTSSPWGRLQTAEDAGRIVGPLRLDWLRLGVWMPVSAEAQKRFAAWRGELDELSAARRGKQAPGCARVEARWLNEKGQVRIGDAQLAFDVRPGSFPYGLTLTAGGVDLALSWGYPDGDGPAPTAMVTLHPAALLAGPIEAYEQALELLRWCYSYRGDVTRTVLSRVDLCVDVQTDAVKSRWLTRGQMVGQYLKRARHWGEEEGGVAGANGDRWTVRRFTGFEAGRRGREGLHLRVYDKWAETAVKPAAAYVRELWKANGWDGVRGKLNADGRPVGSVWRVEFELGRKALQSLRLNEVTDLFSVDATGKWTEAQAARAAWAYLTQRWCRIVVDDPRAPDVDEEGVRDCRGRLIGATRPENRPTLPVWVLVQQQAGDAAAPQRVRPSDVKRVSDALLLQARGCLASYLASNCRAESGRVAVAAVMDGLPEAVEARAARAPWGDLPEGARHDVREVVLAGLIEAGAGLFAAVDAAGAAGEDGRGGVPILRGPSGGLVARVLEASPTADLRGHGVPQGVDSSVPPTGAGHATGEAAADGVGAGGGFNLGVLSADVYGGRSAGRSAGLGFLRPWADAARYREACFKVRDAAQEERLYLEDEAGSAFQAERDEAGDVVRDASGGVVGRRVVTAPVSRRRWLALRDAERTASEAAQAAETLMYALGWTPDVDSLEWLNDAPF